MQPPVRRGLRERLLDLAVWACLVVAVVLLLFLSFSASAQTPFVELLKGVPLR